MSHSRITVAATLALSVFALAGCGARQQRLTVGAKSTTEQQILGEILAQHLEAKLGKGSVVRRFGLTGTILAHNALVSGEIDVYPEYSGTALIALHRMEPHGTKEDVRAVIMENYRLRNQCEWIGPLGLESPPVIVIPAHVAKEEKIATLSDAEQYGLGWRMYITADYQERADGLPLLMRLYHLRQSAALRIAEPAQLYNALERDQATMIAGAATDSRLADERFQVLEEDKKALPPYEAGWAVRSAALERLPELAPALRALVNRIPTAKMREMVKLVEADQRTAEAVATEFLKGAGI